MNVKGFIAITIVILISVLALGMAGVAWYYEENKDEQDTLTTTVATNTTVNTNTVVTNLNTNNVVDPTADWETYTNDEYGFSLKFSPEWEGYSTIITKDKTGGTFDLQSITYDSINFKHPKRISNSGNPGEVSFSILKFSKDIDASTFGTSHIINIGEFQFALSRGNAAAPDEMIDLSNQIDDIISTFKLVDPIADWQMYGIDEDNLYREVSGEKVIISLEISLAKYHYSISPYGVIFWKKGEMRTTILDGFGDGNYEYEYEHGVLPNFYFYSFSTNSLKKIPEQTFDIADQIFQKVFKSHFSSTESYILIELGTYDTKSSAFVPGLIESQPVITTGLIYDTENNQWLVQDPISTFIEAIDSKTTQWRSIYWDSINNIIVGRPGGEGCGPYSTLEYVDTNSGVLTTVGGRGSYNFDENIGCNPHNGGYWDGPWFVLVGTNVNNLTDVYLFNTSSLEPVKSKTDIPNDSENAAWIEFSSWNTEGEWPIFELSGGQIIDFNE